MHFQPADSTLRGGNWKGTIFREKVQVSQHFCPGLYQLQTHCCVASAKQPLLSRVTRDLNKVICRRVATWGWAMAWLPSSKEKRNLIAHFCIQKCSNLIWMFSHVICFLPLQRVHSAWWPSLASSWLLTNFSLCQVLPLLLGPRGHCVRWETVETSIVWNYPRKARHYHFAS